MLQRRRPPVRGEYPEGSPVTLTASPRRSLRISPGPAVRKNRVPLNAPCRSVEAEVAVALAVSPNQSLLTLTPGVGGSVSAAERPDLRLHPRSASPAAVPMTKQLTVTLEASPSAHHTVTGWTGCTRFRRDTCEVDVGASAAEVEATFQPQLQALPSFPPVPARSAPTAASSSPAPPKLAPAAANIIEGSTVTLTATPDPHQAVTWSGCAHSDEDTLRSRNRLLRIPRSKPPLPRRPHPHPDNAGTGTGQITCNGAPCAATYPAAPPSPSPPPPPPAPPSPAGVGGAAPAPAPATSPSKPTPTSPPPSTPTRPPPKKSASSPPRRKTLSQAALRPQRRPLLPRQGDQAQEKHHKPARSSSSPPPRSRNHRARWQQGQPHPWPQAQEEGKEVDAVHRLHPQGRLFLFPISNDLRPRLAKQVKDAGRPARGAHTRA